MHELPSSPSQERPALAEVTPESHLMLFKERMQHCFCARLKHNTHMHNSVNDGFCVNAAHQAIFQGPVFLIFMIISLKWQKFKTLHEFMYTLY